MANVSDVLQRAQQRAQTAQLPYAGALTPEEAFVLLQQLPGAVLVDVRTDAERAWVGQVPGAKVVAWKQWPQMLMNPDFDTQLQAVVPSGSKVLLLCRSGVRSVAAAQRATELGLQAYSILEGFEGDLDANGQRGKLNGWRYRGLPWQQ